MECERSVTRTRGARLRAALVTGLSAAVLTAGHLSASAHAWAGARAHVSVALRGRARAGEGFLSVRDVARVEGGEAELVRRVAGVLLGAAPRPGGVRTISRGFVRSRLRQEGISLENVIFCGEGRVALLPRLSGAAVSFEEAIVERVRAHVADELRRRVDAVEVDLLSFRWIRRPAMAGRLGFAISRRAAGSGLGRAKYVLDCLDATSGRAVGRALAWTDSVLYRAAVASRGPVAEGAELDFEDLAAVTVPVRDTGLRLLSDPEEASRREAARRIQAGEPICEADLLAPRLVRQGETVTVVIEKPNYRITSRALAMRSGARGEVVPVENLSSGREFLARVVDESTVEAVR